MASSSLVHQLPSECYAPTDSDEESFVVLSHEQEPRSPRSLSTLPIEESLDLLPENVLSAEDLAISQPCASLSSAADEVAHASVLLAENRQLKETLEKNKALMKNQYETLKKWQEDVQTVHESHKIKFNQMKTYVTELQAQNARLTARANASEHFDMATTSDPESIDALKLECSKKMEELIKKNLLLEQTCSTFEANNAKLEKENETIKHDFDEREQNLLEQITSLKVADLQYKKIVNENDNMLQQANSKIDALVKEMSDKDQKHAEEIASLKAELDKVEEIKTLREQLMIAQAVIMDVKQKQKNAELECGRLETRWNQAVDEIKGHKEQAALMNEQMELYRSDFDTEVRKKQEILADKNKLAADLQDLHLRNEKLTEEVELLRGRCTYVEINTGTSSSTANEPPPSPPLAAFQCPLCTARFRLLRKLEEHVELCLGDNAGA